MSGMAGLRPAFTLLVFVIVAFVIVAAASGAHAENQQAALGNPDAWRADMLHQINRIRAERGIVPLRIDARLNRAAQLHSDDMARRDFFDHRSPEGARMTDRADRSGYRWRRIIENIAAGYPNAAAAIQGWMESPGHRAGLLDSRVRDAGFGYVFLPHDGGQVQKAHYWTLLVGHE